MGPKNKSKASECILIFVEGETEKYFYNEFIRTFKNTNNRSKILIKNIKGIGRYENKAIRIFRNDIKSKYKGSRFIVFFAYDSDVFEFQPKPPINWQKVEKEFRKSGINEIYHLKAVKCIEDWFLNDLNGILSFLNIKDSRNILKGNTGVDKLQNIFKKSNKIYIKGACSEEFIKSLDINLIYSKLEPLLGQLKVILS